MKILLLSPDSSKNPFGGMGAHAKGVMTASDYEFVEHSLQNRTIMLQEEPGGGFSFYEQLIPQASDLPNIKDLEGVDLVHSYDASSSLQGHAIAKMLGVPHIMTLQLSMTWLMDMFYSYVPVNETKVVTAIEMSCMNVADAVIHVSKEYLKKYGILNANSFYMPNGIDIDEWESTPKLSVNLPGRKNAKKLCYIGRYAEMKNIEGIVNANIPEDIDIYFIGSSKGGHDYYFDIMIDYVEKNKNAYYLGPTYGEDKINTLRAMDAVIVPSHHEPFGIVCLEALAAECILLSSFKSGMSEYLTEDVAINCGTSLEEISKGIQQWLNISTEETEKRKLQGKEFCKQYSWKNAVKILEDIYKHVLNKKI